MKDAAAISSLRGMLHEQFRLPLPAIDWLADLYVVIQRIDDIADEGEIPRNELNELLWKSLVSLPANPFFQAHAHSLMPLVQSMILKWQASDFVERNDLKDQLPKAYMWRASFFDVVLQVLYLVHGEQVATAEGWKVMAMYSEKLNDYLVEFQNA
jgi:hypothetical protein